MKFEEDRLSELPEHILHHIFSFLPFKQVVQTSMLSRRWERVWNTDPSLEFGETIFELDFLTCFFLDPDQLEEDRIKLKKSYNCLEQVLRNRPMSLKKFTLDMLYHDLPECLSFIDKCVCYAIGSNVQELKLGLFAYVCKYYNLPQIVLYANSIEILELSYCKLELPRNNVMLSSLRKLSLFQVDVDDHMMKNLVAGCPLIEYLHVVECSLSLKNLVLFGLSRLKEIKLENDYTLERVDIETLNVQLLSFSCLPLRLINFASNKNLRSLHLTLVSITDEQFCSHVPKLPLLEDLRIIQCYKLKCVKISSPYLRTLHCVKCDELFELKVDAPNLHNLLYSGDVISLSLNAVSLSKVDVKLSCRNTDTQWYLKYVDFLAKFHRFSEVLNLHISTNEDVMVPRELRQILPSPLSSVKHLNLRLLGGPINFSIKKLLDGLLWISPHAKSIYIDYHDFSKASLKFEFSYKKQLNYKEETISCCKSLPVSCWQHCIEKVNVEKKESHDLKGAAIFETIDLLYSVGDS
ncbi:hypothetical protein LWI28_013904 [Acer negundo]|uniref:F-box domain-containing protein n=1 Tax=Acer negundo TaxID=4023 RepID=A0AAD5IEX0_ACENE|nr:hypothetical protein LWI28_013904 [Acer negundo]